MSLARFYQIRGLSGFLPNDPSDLEYDEQYRRNKEVVGSIKVVNELASVQEFNSSIMKNVEQKLYLLQMVEHHRRQFVEPTKAGAIKQSTLITY